MRTRTNKLIRLIKIDAKIMYPVSFVPLLKVYGRLRGLSIGNSSKKDRGFFVQDEQSTNGGRTGTKDQTGYWLYSSNRGSSYGGFEGLIVLSDGFLYYPNRGH